MSNGQVLTASTNHCEEFCSSEFVMPNSRFLQHSKEWQRHPLLQCSKYQRVEIIHASTLLRSSFYRYPAHQLRKQVPVFAYFFHNLGNNFILVGTQRRRR